MSLYEVIVGYNLQLPCSPSAFFRLTFAAINERTEEGIRHWLLRLHQRQATLYSSAASFELGSICSHEVTSSPQETHKHHSALNHLRRNCRLKNETQGSCFNKGGLCAVSVNEFAQPSRQHDISFPCY
jgi:hypothetical protein